MIEFQRVSKSYRAGDGRKVILHDVDLRLTRGRSVGLLGRNGAGKSTVLRMIGGHVEPDSGRILRSARISWPLGFGGAFHGAMTGAQNVRFVARIYGVDTDELVAFVEEFSELGEFLHMPVSTYSSGMRARLAFGASMGVNFEVYLVDEITAVGDTGFRRKCQAAFDAKSATADIVMVSHSTGAIRRFCDSGIVLENGAATFYDDVEEAIAAHEANMAR